VTLSATGGTSPYQYIFNTGAYSTTTLYTNLRAGADSVYVEDHSGCKDDTVFTITQPSAMHIDSMRLSNNKCFGDTSGLVKVYASGAVPPYTYSVNSGAFQASNILTGLHAGTELVVIKDNNGCPADSNVRLTQPAQLAAWLDSISNPTCEGFTDGYIAIRAVGGTPAYLFSYPDSLHYSSQMLYTKIGEGNYVFYIKDGNNCVFDTSFQFTGYPHIVVQDVALSNPRCYSELNGQIVLNVTGGVQPLSYQLNNSGAFLPASTFDSLGAGVYKVIIKDSKNCVKDTSATLVQPDSISISASVLPNDCIGIDNSGIVSVVVKGGTTPYNYLWSSNPEVTGPEVTDMPNGDYMVWVHDAHNCADSMQSAIKYDDCCKPFIPNAFTPNNDGKDDLFRVRFKGDMKLIGLSIYNRYGQRVYYSIYIDQGWDGTVNGVPQDLGVYEYYMKATCGNKGDHVIEMHGDVTLIR
jgi:gliding motility-associated-like protein